MNRFHLLLLTLLGLSVGCASAPQLKPEVQDSQTQNLLSQAASQFAAPDAPRSLNLLDEAQVEWRADKSMKITVHEIWAARIKPEHPLPAIATINKDSQNLTIQTLQLYNLDDKGAFNKSPINAEIQWAAPEAVLPPALSNITSAVLPELNAGQALELTYTLETKTSNLLTDKEIQKDIKKPHPVSAEGSFAFRWNDYTPSLQRELDLSVPKDIALYGTQLRIPKTMTIDENKTSTPRLTHFALNGPQSPVPFENYQPVLQDLAPLTAFTLSKSWEDAVMPYRKRVKQILDNDYLKIQDLVGDAGGNTAEPLMTRLAEIKNAVHQKVVWVDTGLPVYLNPERHLDEIVESGKGSSSDMAVLLTAALKSVKIEAQVYLYRQAASGLLLTDMPALSQFDGVLVAVPSGKDLIWMDPTEPLAAPGVLPLGALDQKTLAVLDKVSWKLTPPFGAKDHRKERDVLMEISPDGRLRCTVDLLAFGSSELALRQFFRMADDQKRRDLVIKGLSKRFPGAALTDYHFGDYQDLTKPLDVHYTFQVSNFVQFTKAGFLFYPLVFEDVEDFFSVLRDSRQTPVVIPQNFNSVTRVLVKLPYGYKVDELPKDGSLSNPVAEFISNAKLQFGTLTYERYLGLKQREIAPGKDFNDLLTFYQAVLNQDRTPFKIIRGK